MRIKYYLDSILIFVTKMSSTHRLIVIVASVLLRIYEIRARPFWIVQSN